MMLILAACLGLLAVTQPALHLESQPCGTMIKKVMYVVPHVLAIFVEAAGSCMHTCTPETGL